LLNPAAKATVTPSLEIEITETALVREFRPRAGDLAANQALGVRIAMDDFGTGYSSLSNLRAFRSTRSRSTFVHQVGPIPTSRPQPLSVPCWASNGTRFAGAGEVVETEPNCQSWRPNIATRCRGYLLGRPAAIGSFRNLTHDDARLDPAADSPLLPAKIA